MQLGIIPESANDVAVIKPSDFTKAAEAICRLTLPEIAAKYKHVSETDAPFACLDIAYQATLLMKGFGKLLELLFFCAGRSDALAFLHLVAFA